MAEFEIEGGYTPGLIGDLTSLHARYYNRLWTLGPAFEREMAEGIGAFVSEYRPGRDGLWTVRGGNESVRGGIIIDGRSTGRPGAQLRYFILEKALHGQGWGRRLLETAMAFCRQNGFERVYLWTVEELKSALYLYRDVGFEATDETDLHTGWETQVPYRLFEWRP
jgi:GNAT superfamily N-acetyltransferase